MEIARTAFEDVFLIALRPLKDERGSFARVFSADTFRDHGLCTSYPEHSAACNLKRGILRGLHYQVAPYGEIKVIRCTFGRIFDVLVDIRPTSSTFGQWLSFELDAENPQMLYVPAGIAHGYQTLSDISHIEYLISEPYHAESVSGIKWDSAELAIRWPIADPILSERDRSHPLFAR